MGLFGSSELDVAIERATSELLPGAQEDLGCSLEVCDMIKGKRVPARDAMRSLRARLLHRNPNVQMLAIKLADACVKNAGEHFLLELASREFVDTVAGLARNPATNAQAAALAAEHMQVWALLCRDQAGLGYIYEAYQELKRGGHPFPPPPRRIDQAITRTLAPPDWSDASLCFRCRVPFSMTTRKHHCRNCGNVFCQACSARTLSLPEFGIPEAVRVCEPCFVRRTENRTQCMKTAPLPAAPPPRHASPTPSEREEAEVAAAIARSLDDSRAPAADEDAMLRAAIAASLGEPAPAPPPPAPPLQLISEMDKENAKLFAQLVDRLALAGPAGSAEPEIEALAVAMDALKLTLRQAIQEARQASPEMASVLATLEISLTKYQLLKHQAAPPPRSMFDAPPSTYYPQRMPPMPPAPVGYHALPSQPPPPPLTEGQLLDEEPLIQL